MKLPGKRLSYFQFFAYRQKLRCSDNKGENIYTGVAKKGRVGERLTEHLRGGVDPIPGGSWFSIKQKRSISDARAEEKQVIKNEEPKQNE